MNEGDRGDREPSPVSPKPVDETELELYNEEAVNNFD